MKLRTLVLGLLMLIASTAMAQDTVMVKTKDSTRLNTAFPMLAEYPRPAIYNTWFKRIADCEGLSLPPQAEIDKIKFVVVNYESFQANLSGIEYDAIMLNRQHTMIVRLPSVWDYDVIAHEFLHFVLWYHFGNLYEAGSNNTHPAQYFGKCNIRPS